MVGFDPVLYHLLEIEVVLLDIILGVIICDAICQKLVVELLIPRLSHLQITFKAAYFKF